jgi:hypothetical protein
MNRNGSKSNLSYNNIKVQEETQNHEIISEMVSSPHDGNFMDGQSIMTSENQDREPDNSYSDNPKHEIRSQHNSIVHSKGSL